MRSTLMRGLAVIALITLLIGCGGSGGEDDAGNTATAPNMPATATAESTTAASETAQPASPPAARAATETEAPESSPTTLESGPAPVPVVMGTPAADLPHAGRIGASVRVGIGPTVVAVGHGSIWVQNDIDGTLSRIDPVTNAVVATIPIATPLGPAQAPSEILGLRQGSPALAVDATSVWATKPEEQAIVQVDPQTNSVVATIALEAKAVSIASDGASLWVALFGADSVVRVDTATGEVVATIPNVPTPAGIAIQPDAVWVANHRNDSVTRIDPATNEVVAQVPVGWPGAPLTGWQCGLCATEILANEHGVWVRLWRANTIARIDAATNRLAAIIPVGIEPRSLASDARGVWVGHLSTAGLLLIDPATNQVVATIPASDAPYQLPAIALWEDTIWVARLSTNDLARIDLQPE